ncbi:hypothetical protein [Pontimonas salivibrio]|uniref:hypothetical protein n=1 Tax=Pontimonas salivibrio TaxID=1159327 RepID=UPI00147504FB|nr:hypothetical protein [Pontimonas salivibrio]
MMVPATREATGVAGEATGLVANAEGDLIALIVRTALIALIARTALIAPSVLGALNAPRRPAMGRALVGDDPQELTPDALRDPELIIAIGHAGRRT